MNWLDVALVSEEETGWPSNGRLLVKRLYMGHYTSATQVSRMNRRPGRKLKPLRERLTKLEIV